ncbi:MAG: TRAP transporter substrate-binding protein [Pseudomonadota bacterium]|nr:TRAP transporter substrate-binding protein [Pseudomonadota bacterium]MEC8128547.1 TRAP transporter substrate-binding protein [Pseudomonadota bacterium]MEC8672777.1 TRAP transporter substrate-binding protein [Pseudomonadota bacterium]
MKKTLATLAALVPLALAGNAVAADKTLTISSWAGPGHTMNANVFPMMISEMESCSGGSLSGKVEFGLASPPAQYDTIRDGVADIGWIVFGYTPGKFETTKLAELPGNTGNATEMSVAFQKTYDKYLAAAKEAKGVNIMANFVHGPGNVNTTKPISSYADLVGMKMRVGGGVANDVGTALGVAGVNMPAPAVYEAISSGVTEGVFFPMETMYAFKIAELAKYTYSNPQGMYTTAFGLIMNADTYADLSDAHKACVDKLTGVEMARRVGTYWDEADALGLEKFKEMGGQLTVASAEDQAYFAEKTAGIEATVVSAASARGIDGAAALAYYRSLLK